MTNDLIRRVQQHKQKLVPGFTSKYKINQLAYYEIHPAAIAAIEREKQLKGWTRDKKIELIESMNPAWDDLTSSLYEKLDHLKDPSC